MRAAPATLLWLASVGLFAAAAAAGTQTDPRAALSAASMIRHPVELQLLLSRPHQTSMRSAKRRAERRLIDFVELMWPVLDPSQPFVRGWVQEALCAHLEAVTDGVITKLAINVPPGFTKSRIVNVMWPAWEWGPKNRPDLRFMSWSYSDDLAEDQNADCRKVIESPVYQRLWRDRFSILKDSDAKSYYKNTKGGWRRSSSVQGQGTGFRADRLIFDDPHAVKHADSEAALQVATRWFARTLPTRVRNPGGEVRVKVPYWVREVHGLGLVDDPNDDKPVQASATIGIGQRVHLHDIFGVILKNPALGYEHLVIEMRYKGDLHPARMCAECRGAATKTPCTHLRGSSIGYKDPRTAYGELADKVRYPAEAVDRIEASMMLEGGTDAVAAQHDQWPLELSGSWFKTEWLPVIDPHEVPIDVSAGKRGWDFGGGGTSAKADPTATGRLGRGQKGFYLWHTAAKRGSPGDVEAFIRQQHADDAPGIDWSIPEDPGTGKLYADYVKRECTVGRYVTSSPEAKDKVTRAKPVSAQAQNSAFWIVRHPGWEIARDELVDFPYGDHDDIVDGISRAFAAVIASPPAEDSVGGYVFDEKGVPVGSTAADPSTTGTSGYVFTRA